MNTLTVTEVLGAVNTLPSLSAVVLDLLVAIDQPDVDIDLVARKVALDPALTARALRLANSSFYGMPRQITTMPDAVAVLGLSSVRNLATTTALMGALAQPDPGAVDPQAFWRHAIGTALCARLLASHGATQQDQAYIAGLLHDIGRLVLATRFSGHYQAVLALRSATDCYLLDAERACLGLDHALVGAALAQHWKFPQAICLAVAQHHAGDVPDLQPLTQLVHLADALAHALGFSGDDDELVPLVADATVLGLGLDRQQLINTCADAERQFEAVCSVLMP